MPRSYEEAPEPVMTRVVVRTEFETWMSWEHARMIDPVAMEHATFLWATMHEDRTVDVTLEVPQSHLDYLIAAVGEEYALSALEESITCDAFEIIEAADLKDAIRLIPEADATAPHDQDTFMVSWSAYDVVTVLEGVGKGENDLRQVKLVRLGMDGTNLLLAVTVPCALAEAIRSADTSTIREELSDTVLEKILGFVRQREEDDWDDDVHLPDIDDRDIPF